MSRLSALLGLAPTLPTVVRTLAYIRPVQARAQLAHMIFGSPKPARLGGPPPRLALEAAASDFLPPPAHIQVEAREGAVQIELLARSIEVAPGTVDWQTTRHGPLFAYHLHEQDWLRHGALSSDLRIALMRDWVERHRVGVGWDPHPISLRLLSWAKLLLTPGALPAMDSSGEDGSAPGFSSVLRTSMADQAETLSRGLETRLQANHLLSNLIGVVFAGLLLEGGGADRWRARSPLLIAELDRQVGGDGAHEERSPMYHALLLENLLDLINLAKASPRTPAGLTAALSAKAARMLEALVLWTLSDGRIALFADSAWDVAAETSALVDYGTRLGVVESAPDRARPGFTDGGYARLTVGAFDLLASLAGPSPAHQPGHAHCDTGSFELCVGGRRLVADTGVHEYVPGPRRDQARSTRSHATLVFDGQEQSELWAAHRVGGRLRIGACEVGDDFFTLEMEGWRNRSPRHVRSVFVRDDEVLLVDVVRAEGHSVESRIPFAPGWQVTLVGRVAQVAHEAGGAPVTIELPEALIWEVEAAPFFPGFHRVLERCVLVGRGHTPLELRTRIAIADEGRSMG
jgi:uncharacterized heparinase superfamily protein